MTECFECTRIVQNWDHARLCSLSRKLWLRSTEQCKLSVYLLNIHKCAREGNYYREWLTNKPLRKYILSFVDIRWLDKPIGKYIFFFSRRILSAGRCSNHSQIVIFFRLFFLNSVKYVVWSFCVYAMRLIDCLSLMVVKLTGHQCSFTTTFISLQGIINSTMATT